MTTEEIRDARKTFAAQLTAMIRDFERQTGKTIGAINIERDTFKRYPPSVGKTGSDNGVNFSLFKGVYLAIE